MDEIHFAAPNSEALVSDDSAVPTKVLVSTMVSIWCEKRISQPCTVGGTHLLGESARRWRAAPAARRSGLPSRLGAGGGGRCEVVSECFEIGSRVERLE